MVCNQNIMNLPINLDTLTIIHMVLDGVDQPAKLEIDRWQLLTKQPKQLLQLQPFQEWATF